MLGSRCCDKLYIVAVVKCTHGTNLYTYYKLYTRVFQHFNTLLLLSKLTETKDCNAPHNPQKV